MKLKGKKIPLLRYAQNLKVKELCKSLPLMPRPPDALDEEIDLEALHSRQDTLQKLVRRMEHCARSREESTRMLSMRFAERDVVRRGIRQEQEVEIFE